MQFATVLKPELAAHYHATGLWLNRNFFEIVEERARAHPDREVFADATRRVSYGELKREIERCAEFLRSIGIKRGDVVTVQLPNRIAFPVVFFEAPHRIRQALDVLATVLEPDRQVGIGRELTKAHEELVLSPISGLSDHFADAKGEFTVVVMPAPERPAIPQALPEVAVLRVELGHLLEISGLSRRQAIKILSDRHRIGANELYRLLEQDHHSGHMT